EPASLATSTNLHEWAGAPPQHPDIDARVTTPPARPAMIAAARSGRARADGKAGGAPRPAVAAGGRSVLNAIWWASVSMRADRHLTIGVCSFVDPSTNPVSRVRRAFHEPSMRIARQMGQGAHASCCPRPGVVATLYPSPRPRRHCRPALGFLTSRLVAGLTTLVLVAGGGCGNVNFIDAPFAPRHIEFTYSVQEDVTVLRWHMSAEKPDSSVRFQLLDAGGTW